MSKEADARAARRARIAALSADEKQALIRESDARHEAEHDAFVSDPVLPVLMDALIASLVPARHDRRGRALLREARALRAELIGENR